MHKRFHPVFIAGLILMMASLIASSAVAGELTLEDAVNEALQNNPRIRETQAYELSAQSDRDAARADFFPKLSANYSYVNLKDDPIMRIYGRETVVNSRDQHHWDVSVTQPLFTGFMLTARHNLAKLGVETKEMESLETQCRVAHQAQQGYFNLLMAQRSFEVAASALNKLESHEKDSQSFYKQGLIALNDMLEIQVARAQAQQEKTRAAAHVRNAESSLNIILGREMNQAVALAAYSPNDSSQIMIEDLVSEGLQNRPEMGLMEQAIAGKQEEERLAKGEFFPRVDLFGTYEQNGEDFGADTNLFSNDHNASMGIQAQWVFFEAGKTRAKTASARHQKKALEEARESLEDRIKLEIQQAFLDLSVARDNVDTARQALEQAREHWRITEVKYAGQLATSTELLDAVTYLTEAEANLYRARYGQGLAQADLDWAVGKKWQYEG